MNTVAKLLDYIDKSTSPYHTVLTSAQILKEAGFKELNLGDEWQLTPGDYYVKVYDSTLMAFHIGADMRESLHVASAHTDFPALRVKPNPLLERKGYGRLNVESYGGLILNTWLDRPLSMAGAVVCRTKDSYEPTVHYIDVQRPLLTIPNLAIHMNRQINDGVALNKQNHMLPLFMMSGQLPGDSTPLEEEWLTFLSEEVPCNADDIISYELTIYPVEGGTTFGRNDEFISSSRLDNLTSCMACLEGIKAAKQVNVPGLRMIALFDNEEVGSRTKQGGASMVLPQVLERIYMSQGFTKEMMYADMGRGFMISSDVAHAYHPNYPEKNDITNIPVLNSGVVLKIASSQSYAGDAKAIGVVSTICEEANIPYQVYVNRSDIPGGSTVGSISSAILPMRTMDVGVPLLAMHSARETMGAQDQEALENLMKEFLG
ncbi:MAG: M18 family aminopeptidase [Veillonella sp.]|uniref:M18 family aminopeptidase n=1 Tax=Veillonella sp. TaxID=1926307 RepID=UPI0025F5DB27|nr:M18 family aminopeptidase [Veillonella sp.]MBS4912585.1 M18 family aminopeptidase [Veillonella sp.]